MPDSGASDGPDSGELAAEFASVATGRFDDVRAFATIDSTNAYLLREAHDGAPDGVVAVADHQSAGRGRLQRNWEAPPGSALLCSVLVRPTAEIAGRVPLLTIAAGVAMVDAVRATAGVPVVLKWPNDLRCGGAKLGGILAEAQSSGGSVDAVVIGCGLNLRAAALPEEVAAIATSLEQHGADVRRAELLHEFLVALESWLTELAAPDGDTVLLTRYAEMCETLGERVRVVLAPERDGSAVEGVADRIGPLGQLVIVDDQNVEHVVDHGDIVRLR